jgi:DNA-directed RNA polymerase subunit RPC12/RpoP
LIDCPNCGEPLALIRSDIFPDEDVAAKLDLGQITDLETGEIVARYALVHKDGSYRCPLCSTRHRA